MLKVPKIPAVIRRRKPPNLFVRHCSAIFTPPIQTLNYFIQKCSSMAQLKSLHAQIILRGFGDDAVTLSKVISISALSSFADLQYAYYLFDKIPQRNRHMYNTLIRASSDKRSSGEAILLYKEMVCCGVWPNEFTFPFVLKACGKLRKYWEGALVHLNIVKLGFCESYTCVQNGLVNFYIGCGRVEFARVLFDGMRFRSLVSWNSMIGGYAKIGCSKEAFSLFCGMRKDEVRCDGHTFVSLLSLCSRIGDAKLGRFIHWYVEINGSFVDVYVSNALLDMYAKCGSLAMAERVFEQIVDKNVVSWTSMVNAYAKHGFVELAEGTFSRMPVKNVVSWNSMLSCYLLNGCHRECVELFYKMCDSRMVPDETTIVSVISACSQMGDVGTGKKLHDYLRNNGMEPSVTLCNSLIDMYAKCGLTEMALDVFFRIPEKNIVSWNTVIKALALHGCGYKAIELFQEMEASEIRPDGLTFGGLLVACCHCGYVEIGRYFFRKMCDKYGIPYDIEHYACMVDILGRAGLLEDAVELVGRMEMKPDVVIWGTLLGACRIHRNVPIAKMVLKQVLELEPYSGGLYVLLSNIFFEAERWDEMRKMRILMRNLGVRKSNAVSSIEVGGCISEFMVDDKKHEALDLIYTTLHRMNNHLRADGDACDDLTRDSLVSAETC